MFHALFETDCAAFNIFSVKMALAAGAVVNEHVGYGADEAPVLQNGAAAH